MVAGFKYFQARKKGILKNSDLKKGLSFTKKMRKEYSNNVCKRDVNLFWMALSLHTNEIHLIKGVCLKDEFGESQV